MQMDDTRKNTAIMLTEQTENLSADIYHNLWWVTKNDTMLNGENFQLVHGSKKLTHTE